MMTPGIAGQQRLMTPDPMQAQMAQYQMYQTLLAQQQTQQQALQQALQQQQMQANMGQPQWPLTPVQPNIGELKLSYVFDRNHKFEFNIGLSVKSCFHTVDIPLVFSSITLALLYELKELLLHLL